MVVPYIHTRLVVLKEILRAVLLKVSQEPCPGVEQASQPGGELRRITVSGFSVIQSPASSNPQQSN